MNENNKPVPDKEVPPQSNDSAYSTLEESIFRGLDALEKAISSDISDLTKLQKFVRKLKSAWSASDGSARALLKDENIPTLQIKYPQSVKLIERLAASENRQSTDRAASLESIIRSYCAEINQPCHGRFPRLTVAHFVEISVNTSSGRTKVGIKSIQSCDWSKIRPAVEQEMSRVWNRPFDAVIFRDKLLSIYDRIDARSHSPTGDVRLMDIFQVMRDESARNDPKAKSGGRLYAYYRDEFSADLSKLWKAQLSGELSGTQLDFSSIRKAEEGFSVIIPSGGIATYGFVKPRR